MRLWLNWAYHIYGPKRIICFYVCVFYLIGLCYVLRSTFFPSSI